MGRRGTFQENYAQDMAIVRTRMQWGVLFAFLLLLFTFLCVDHLFSNPLETSPGHCLRVLLGDKVANISPSDKSPLASTVGGIELSSGTRIEVKVTRSDHPGFSTDPSGHDWPSPMKPLPSVPVVDFTGILTTTASLCRR